MGFPAMEEFKKVWRDFIAANWNPEVMMPKVPGAAADHGYYDHLDKVKASVARDAAYLKQGLSLGPKGEGSVATFLLSCRT